MHPTLKHLLYTLLLFWYFPSYATHIVGGEIHYRCLGNDQYEVSLTVFRDCDTGVPWFDMPAAVGVFDDKDSLIFDIRMAFRNNDTLDVQLFDPCMVAPPNVCIHTTTYLDTIALPFRSGGYQLVYQRCCRNQSIVNIQNPTSTGATYSAFLSETALLTCNSSAIFQSWPPVYVCTDAPILYDHSANDIDGDSVVYELCTPFTGATAGQSRPQPPNNPPYNPVVWVAPFGQDNMIGGPDSLKIDAQTGLLTGTPHIPGVFVVGVCAKEYRNGQLIGTTRRDFQYVVGACTRKTSSAFFTPSVQCINGLQVSFDNQSQSLGSGYQWYFGDTITNSTSSITNPIHIYPDTGWYTITLISDPTSVCADTSQQEVYLQYESIFTDFDFSLINCADSFALQMQDLSTDSISQITDWNWNFGNGASSTAQNPSITYQSNGPYIINLNVIAQNGCTGSHKDTVDFKLARITSADTVVNCLGSGPVQLNPNGDSSISYIWGNGITPANSVSPTVNPGGAGARYPVAITAINGTDTCIHYDTVTVLYKTPVIIVLNDTATCLDSITLNLYNPDINQYSWLLQPSGTLLSNGPQVTVPVLGSQQQVVLNAIDRFGCPHSDFFFVDPQQTPVDLILDYDFVACDSTVEIQFYNRSIDSSQGPVNTWNWDFGDGNSSNLKQPTHRYNQGGTYLVQLSGISTLGCTGETDTLINLNPINVALRDTIGLCVGESDVPLNPNGNNSYTYQWSPSASLQNPTSSNPIASPSVPTTYTVTISSVNGNDSCSIIKTIHVNFPTALELSTAPTTTFCSDTIRLTASSNRQSTIQWFSDSTLIQLVGLGSPVQLAVPNLPCSDFYVQATDKYGCISKDTTAACQAANSINTNFSYQILGCAQNGFVQFTDLTADTTLGPILSWNWSISDGQTAAVQNPLFYFNQSGTYTATLNVMLSNGCKGSFSQSFTINVATILDSTNITLCHDVNSRQLNVNGSLTSNYTWSPAVGLSQTNIPNPLATPPSFPFTYTVDVAVTNGTDSCTKQHQITLNQAPDIIIEVPKDTVVCLNTFLVSTNIQNATRIEWSFNPTFSFPILVNVRSFYVGLLPAPSTTTLYVRAYNDAGCMKEDTVRIIRAQQGFPLSFTYDLISCTDTALIDFTNTSTLPQGYGAVSWLWTLNGSTVLGTTKDLTAPLPADTVSSLVTLSLSFSNGCFGFFGDYINTEIPTALPRNKISLCDNQPVELNPGANPIFDYKWSPSIGLSSDTVANPIATPTNTTRYTVTITSVSGTDTCQHIDSVEVIVEPIKLTLSEDTTICNNQIQLSALTDASNTVYWALDDSISQLVYIGDSLYTNVNGRIKFYVQVVDSLGCSALDSVTVITQNTLPAVDFTMQRVGNCTDSIEIIFTNNTGSSSSVTSWYWNLGNGSTDTLANTTAFYLKDSSYQIQLYAQNNDNCEGSANKTLQIQRIDYNTPSDSSLACIGDTVDVSVAHSPYHKIIWEPSSALLQTQDSIASVLAKGPSYIKYKVLVSTQIGESIDTCFRSDSLFINTMPPINLSIIDSSNKCDTLINLLAQSTTSGLSFNWFDTTNQIQSIGNQLIKVRNQQQSTWFLTAKDSLGCVDSIAQKVIFYNFNISGDSATMDCPNSTSLLTVKSSTSAPLNINWFLRDSFLQSDTSTRLLVQQPGAYTVNASNNQGCSDSLTLFVQQLANNPTLTLSSSKDTIYAGETVTLDATSDAQNIQWLLGDYLSIIQGNTAQSTPTETITYPVLVTNIQGCTTIDSITIFVKDVQCAPPYIFIPNSFTPNKDGLNDVLYVRGNTLLEIELLIYDRWGKQVFKSTELGIGWDGNFENKRLPPDVYGFYLKATCLSGQRYETKGNITLIR